MTRADGETTTEVTSCLIGDAQKLEQELEQDQESEAPPFTLAAEIYEVADREGVHPEPFDEVEPSLFYPRQSRDAEKEAVPAAECEKHECQHQ